MYVPFLYVKPSLVNVCFCKGSGNLSSSFTIETCFRWQHSAALKWTKRSPYIYRLFQWASARIFLQKLRHVKKKLILYYVLPWDLFNNVHPSKFLIISLKHRPFSGSASCCGLSRQYSKSSHLILKHLQGQAASARLLQNLTSAPASVLLLSACCVLHLHFQYKLNLK